MQILRRPGARALALLTAALATGPLVSGCADALSLSELRFEEEAGLGGASTQGLEPNNPRPAIGQQSGVPMVWAKGLLLGSGLPGQNGLVTYDRATGELNLYDAGQLDEPVSVHRLPDRSWAHIMLVPMTSVEAEASWSASFAIRAYDPTLGLVEYFEPPFVDYELTGQLREASANIELAALVESPTEIAVVIYDVESGYARLGPALRSSQGMTANWEWPTKWDQIFPGRLDGASGVFQVDFDEGVIAFDRFVALGQPLEPLWQGTFVGSWTHALSTELPEGTELLLYDSETGKVTKWLLDGPQPDLESSELWPRDLSHLVGPFDDNSFVVTYNEDTGVANRPGFNILESSVVR